MTDKEEIIRVVTIDDLKEIYELIDQGVDPFTKNLSGRTAISYVLSNTNSTKTKILSKKIARYLYVTNK